MEYPFDTIKTRLQVQPLTLTGEATSGTLNGPLDCIRQGFKEEGFRGFYKVLFIISFYI